LRRGFKSRAACLGEDAPQDDADVMEEAATLGDAVGEVDDATLEGRAIGVVQGFS